MRIIRQMLTTPTVVSSIVNHIISPSSKSNQCCLNSNRTLERLSNQFLFFMSVYPINRFGLNPRETNIKKPPFHNGG